MPLQQSQSQSKPTFYHDQSPMESTTPVNTFLNYDNHSDLSLPVQGINGHASQNPLNERSTANTNSHATNIDTRSGSNTTGIGIGMGNPQRNSQTFNAYAQSGDERTHLSNITPATFYHSMSPRLQRDQNAKIPSPTSDHTFPHNNGIHTAVNDHDERRRHMTRYSDASIVTLDHDSRTDNFTTRTSNDGVRNLRTVRSQASNAPLRPAHLDPSQPITTMTTTNKAERSPRSLRTSFGLNSRSSQSGEGKEFGHRKLASEPNSPDLVDISPSSAKSGVKSGRNYEYYNGNAMFFLKGRLLNARQRPINAITAFLANLPSLLFFIFSASYLWHNVSPAIPIIYAYLVFVCLSSFLHASFSDPGILPRHLHPHPHDASDDDPLALGPTMSNWIMVKSWTTNHADLPHTAMEVPVKYCGPCKTWRPPRAHHCRTCDACVETQDHHCLWLNNCVGRRNYRPFFTFIGTGMLLSIFLFGASLGHLLHYMHHNHVSFGQTLSSDWSRRGAFALVFYSALIFPYPSALWGYHVFLLSRGETTREYLHSLKFMDRDRHRPFDRHSIFRNWVQTLCRPRPPTYMQFKGTYTVGNPHLAVEKTIRTRRQKEKGDIEMSEVEKGAEVNGTRGPLVEAPVNSTPRPVTARSMNP